MKNIIVCFFVVLFAVSCNSNSTEPDNIPEENSSEYNINLISEQDSVIVGDTLYITINNNIEEFQSLTLNVGRGNFEFNSYFSDTTVSFVYDWSAKFYLKLFLNDGVNEIMVDQDSIIVTPRYFNLSFTVGSIWKYEYNYTDNYAPTGTSIKQNGIHTWELFDSEIINGDTIYAVRQIRDDIKVDNGKNSTIKDTVFNNFIVSQSSIKINWQFYGGTKEFTVQNHSYTIRYPLRPSDYVAIDDRVGPAGYYYYRTGSHALELKEEFILLDFYKP